MNTNLLDGNNQPSAGASEDLSRALEAFKQPAIAGTASNLLTPTTSTVDASEEPTEEIDTSVEDVEETEVADEEEQEPSAFAEQFEAQFGMKPDEAVSLVNSLVSLRDEMQLMKEWQVSPGDYNTRMEAVREFYSTLPEADREQFNSPEGAKVIWQHLSKSQPTVAKRTRGNNVRPTRSTQPPAEVIKRSDILAMDDRTYKQNLPRITAAYREGRVLDNQ